MRLDRVEFYRSMLKDKYKSTVAIFNYYLTIGDQYYERGDFDRALEYYFKVRECTKDSSRVNLIENKIKACQKI